MCISVFAIKIVSAISTFVLLNTEVRGWRLESVALPLPFKYPINDNERQLVEKIRHSIGSRAGSAGCTIDSNFPAHSS